jgi:hypothetical protein
MKGERFAEMSNGELVERFTTMALEQDEALLMDEIGKYNKIYDQMEAVKQELKARAGDQRRLLLPLLEHRNAQVRLKAAITTLAIEPEAARNALQKIVDQKEFPQAANARGMIEAVAAGRYVPS